ncbi:MAG: protoheme IX farnesyltransferase [Planctomycetes bacterium]|nr:protoheme IX farnesyltransferase [Planctomycetota bacterium]
MTAGESIETAPSPTPLRRCARFLHDLLVLTKYRITLVALFTGYAAIAVHGSHASDWGYIAPCLAALFLTGGAANTLNQLFESGKDAVMNRTKSRRPLPAGRISPLQATVFAIIQFVAAQAILLGCYHSWLAAAFSLLTVVYYSFFYTLWLKPRHYLNIVIGGVPGAMGPLIAWAAIANEVAAAPLAMSALIFLWTPPHVWALAIKLKDDYARAGIPMLPVVKGVDETTRQIVIYTLVMVAGTLALPIVVTGFSPAFERSPSYTVLALVLGAVFITWTLVLWCRRPMLPTMPLFRFSIVYIAALFTGMVVDAFCSH